MALLRIGLAGVLLAGISCELHDEGELDTYQNGEPEISEHSLGDWSEEPIPTSNLAGDSAVEATSEMSDEVRRPLSVAACTCPGGVDCKGNTFTGSCGQIVCGADFRMWQCKPDGWKQIGSQGCTC